MAPGLCGLQRVSLISSLLTDSGFFADYLRLGAMRSVLEGAARCGAGRRQALRGGWARQVPHRTGLLRASNWPGCTRGPQRPHRRSKLGLLALIHVFDLPCRQAEDGYPPFLWAAHLRRDKMGAYKKNERNIMVGTTHFRRFPAESRCPYSEIVNSPPHAHSRSPEAELR